MKNSDPPIGGGSKILLTIAATVITGYPVMLILLPVAWLLLYTIVAMIALIAILA